VSRPLRVLALEPFFDGSHRAALEVWARRVPAEWTLLTLPGRHWKWRMRGAAAYFASRPELAADFDLVFATSFVPLAEMVGLAPKLAAVPKVLYFHENQLAYPSRSDTRDPKDHHFGMTQLVSGLCADALWFNSAYNRDSFVEAGRQLLQRMPDRVRPGWIAEIEQRSAVVPVPLDLPDLTADALEREPSRLGADGPLLLWAHRWEHDKGPDLWADCVATLAREGWLFRVALAGQRFRTVPPAIERLRADWPDRIVHAGFLERSEYEATLMQADVAVSTARQEFFGISMLEATHFGARPLVPDGLAYPELYRRQYRYPPGQPTSALRELLRRWHAGERLRGDRRHLTAPFHEPAWASASARFEALVGGRSSARPGGSLQSP
jgi:glycosyltransferase involved in cell wall biosynthesis